jgi:hypothetical protein
MFARRLLAGPQLRLVARQVRPAALPIRRYATQPPNMAELESLMQSDPSLRDMMEKLSRRPSAIAAVQEIGDLVQKKGRQLCAHWIEIWVYKSVTDDVL